MYSEMTNEQIDWMIAEKRGWVVCHGVISDTTFTGKDKPIDASVFNRYPSPTTDPRYAMELLEEMANNNDGEESGYNEVIISQDFRSKKWYCEISCFFKPFIADSVYRAISEAWLSKSATEEGEC